MRGTFKSRNLHSSSGKGLHGRFRFPVFLVKRLKRNTVKSEKNHQRYLRALSMGFHKNPVVHRYYLQQQSQRAGRGSFHDSGGVGDTTAGPDADSVYLHTSQSRLPDCTRSATALCFCRIIVCLYIILFVCVVLSSTFFKF